MPSNFVSLHELLEQKVQRFNHPNFIINDPISIPHRFSKLQDVEITAFWVSMLAWGLRKTIINKANELFSLMDNAPHDFILHHTSTDLKRLMAFKHRTFNTTDTLYFIEFFRQYYAQNKSLETAFATHLSPTDQHIGKALMGFHEQFFALPDAPQRTRKHVSTPARNSTCKRLNMFLRWMVRPNTQGVDLGLWQQISPAQLLIPLDVHVERIARRLNLIDRPQTDWKTVLELTNNLRQFDPTDPVKYDFALFGIGLEEKGNLVV